MAFTVEDGSGLAGSNSYASVAEADAYFSDRGETSWTGSSLEKQSALVKATQFIDASYTFVGVIANNSQALAWPRYDAWDKHDRAIAANAVPAQVKQACFELALYSLSSALISNVTSEDRVKRVKAGSAEVEFEMGTKDVGNRFLMVDRLLGSITRSGTGRIRQTARGW